MNTKLFMVLRIIFGVLLVIFGSEKFFHFMPQPEVAFSDAVLNYMGALMNTNTIYLVGLVELVAGLTLIFNKFAALLMIILMSVSINAVLFHATISPGDIYGAIVLLLLNIVMLFGYKNQYKELLY
ncbi:DoxX family membrane protein [Aurantibacter crassamenti]|uniref:DoxX family membrane protein n=1 Tax=Aurantibacter crassamenti TaxID=1837375 RepID=UPI00193A26A1|nr:DoxX family membrane protein [Aurantibacter crassamenti]MBM1106087.1 DoxX family membrane protein [Aurantibacter crassamenti]